MANEPNKTPAGYARRSSDIVGFWDPDKGPIHFIPRHCKIFDSSMDQTKSSTLLIGDLVDACQLVNDKKEVVQGQKGDQVGIWTKPGMRELQKLAGVPVYMYAAGDKDVGKPSPMKLFEISSPKTGEKLPVSEDLRKKSRPQRENGSPGTSPATAGGGQTSFTQDEDPIPF